MNKDQLFKLIEDYTTTFSNRNNLDKEFVNQSISITKKFVDDLDSIPAAEWKFKKVELEKRKFTNLAFYDSLESAMKSDNDTKSEFNKVSAPKMRLWYELDLLVINHIDEIRNKKDMKDSQGNRAEMLNGFEENSKTHKLNWKGNKNQLYSVLRQLKEMDLIGNTYDELVDFLHANVIGFETANKDTTRGALNKKSALPKAKRINLDIETDK
jgi:hypothetical protein